jgi:hypothetical protein
VSQLRGAINPISTAAIAQQELPRLGHFTLNMELETLRAPNSNDHVQRHGAVLKWDATGSASTIAAPEHVQAAVQEFRTG